MGVGSNLIDWLQARFYIYSRRPVCVHWVQGDGAGSRTRVKLHWAKLK
jgi:hypothetical protein